MTRKVRLQAEEFASDPALAETVPQIQAFLDPSEAVNDTANAVSALKLALKTAARTAALTC